MQSIVVTGATGMIGTALCTLAASRGMDVLAIVRPGSKRLAQLPDSPHIRMIPCALQDYASLQLPERYDAFFHLAWDKTAGAARDDAMLQTENIRTTLAAVTLAAKLGCTAFVGAGSQAEYGPTSQPLCAATPTDPRSGYGIAKYAAGKLSRMLCGQLGLRHCWTRILSVYGELDAPHTFIQTCIRTLLAGETPALTPCGQLWDYLYAGDAAEALLAIGERGADGGVYCLGSGKARPMREYAEIIRDQIAPDAVLGFGERDYYPHQPMYLCADLTDLTRDTGYVPTTDFAEGIRRTIQYVKDVQSL